DGHDFLPDAAARGAVAALVEEPPKKLLPNLHLIGVDNTRRALGRLATFVRRQMQATVIAVAGSNGKTTTKHFIGSVLEPFKGCLIVNGDDAALLAHVAQYPGQKVTFGLKPSNDLFATEIHCASDGVRFNLNGNPRRRVFVPMLGKHTALNALAAIAVGRKMG